jgi:hypothetical protein
MGNTLCTSRASAYARVALGMPERRGVFHVKRKRGGTAGTYGHVWMIWVDVEPSVGTYGHVWMIWVDVEPCGGSP